MKKIGFLLVLLLTVSLLGLPFYAHAQDKASFLIDNVNPPPGSTFSVAVYESSGSSRVTIVQTQLNYDPAQLKVTDTDFSDSAFPAELPPSNSKATNSSVDIDRFSTSGVTGQAKIGTITFTAVGNQPNTSVSFDKNSLIFSGDSGDNIWDGSTNGATFSFVAPQTGSTPPTTAATAPKTVSNQPKSQSTQPPLSSSLSAVTGPYNTHPYAAPAISSRPWEAVIVGCGVAIAALVTRLFNLHKKIKISRTKKHRRRLIKRFA
jgi:hypothetical protein